VGFRGIQGVPLFCISITFEVGVAGLIIIGYRRERGFMGEFKERGATMEAGEVVDFRLSGLSWVVIRLRQGRRRWTG
jgi:hypothetical protein